MEQSERITKARMAIILSAPFFGALLMRLIMVRDESVPTFCTDGRRIRYNEKFCASLSDAQLRGVLVHEVAHCAQGHLWRIGARDLKRWNHATDYQINGMLDEYVRQVKEAFEQKHGAGRFVAPWELPKGLCLDHQFDGLASEEIYERLPESSDGGSGSGSASGQPSPGEFELPQDEGEGEGDEEGEGEGEGLEGEWRIAVTQAATAAKARGTLPGCLEKFIAELLQPKVPWREVLREFIRQLARDDYSWQRPSRRYVHSGVLLPSLHSERMGKLVIARDSSASTHEWLAEFNAEVQAALDEVQPENMTILDCDTQIAKVHELEPGDRVPQEIAGGGGTRFAPVFDWIEAHSDEPPAALVYLTDLEGSFPAQEPEYPVLWAVFGRREQAPWGQVVAVK